MTLVVILTKFSPILVAAVLLIVVVGLLAAALGFFSRPAAETVVEIGGQRITAEVARTTFSRSRGLMFRENLAEGCGMIFVFSQEAKHPFWMKNVSFPLDLVFINHNLVVVDLLRALPCEGDLCIHYRPSEPVAYVLEVNAGTFGAEVIGSKATFFW